MDKKFEICVKGDVIFVKALTLHLFQYRNNQKLKKFLLVFQN